MQALSFWNSWLTVYRRLFWVFALFFIAALALAIVSFAFNPAPVFTWQQLQELQVQELPIYSFEVGGFDLAVSTENYILFERWLGNPMQRNLVALDVYLVFFAFGFVVLLSIVTVLPRFWFFVGSGAAVFLLSSLQWDALKVFGFENKIPMITILVIFLVICIYYQFIHTTASFLQRLAAFLSLFIILGFTIHAFADATQPLRHLAITTLPSAIVLLLVFVILVAHEIVASFVTLVGQGVRGSKSLQQYLIISTIYLVNLWLAYWNKIGWMDWKFILPSILLLAISGVLAVWGIRQKQPLYDKILPDGPFAVYFILSLGTIAFACMAYFFASANDIALLSLNDLILYAHIGYGMVFLMYVASNFLGMLSKGLPVHKVLYKPAFMPYFSYRFAGLIFTLAFIFYNTWMVPVNHFISAYYTALGDLFASRENATLGIGYYKRGHFYAPYNQHAATALATLEAERGNSQREQSYLADANLFKPTEFTLLNSANNLLISGYSLKEVLLLRRANRALPASGVIRNNLGLTYARLGLTDSAYVYFSAARENALTRASAEMNLLGLIAKSNARVRVDSVFELLDSEEERVMSNAYALANRMGKMIESTIELPEDSILNLFSASQIGNYLTNHLTHTDTSFLSRCIALAHKKENRVFAETILVPASRACYATGQVNRAFQLLVELIFAGSNPAKHNFTLALWSLDQGKPDVALNHFSYVLNQDSSSVTLGNAVTLAETGRIDEAIIAWDSISRGKDSLFHATAESMKRVLGAPPSWYGDFTEKEKYQYLRYRVPTDDSVSFERLVNQITNEDLRAKALLDRSKKWFSQDEIARASRYFQKLQGLHLTDTRLFTDIKYFELQLLGAQRQMTLLGEQIAKGILFGPYRETQHVYYTALRQEQSGDSVNAAKNFDWLAKNNPYFDEGIVAASDYFQKHTTDKRKSYFILSEALQVNPNSVKILKAYIPLARDRGYDEYAAGALTTLKNHISSDAFIRFVAEKQLSGLLRQ